MRRILLTFALLLILVTAGLAVVWYAGLAEAFLIARTVRATAEENLARQLATPAGYPGRRRSSWPRLPRRSTPSARPVHTSSIPS